MTGSRSVGRSGRGGPVGRQQQQQQQQLLQKQGPGGPKQMGEPSSSGSGKLPQNTVCVINIYDFCMRGNVFVCLCVCGLLD